jgi:hypothetical protein
MMTHVSILSDLGWQADFALRFAVTLLIAKVPWHLCKESTGMLNEAPIKRLKGYFPYVKK